MIYKEQIVNSFNSGKTWLDNNKRYITFTIGLLLVVGTAIIFFFGKAYKQREEIYQLERDKYKDSIQILQDKTGDIVYKIHESTVYEHSLSEKKTVDSLAKILSIKEKEISNYKQIISKTDFSKATAQIDTIYIDKDSFPVYEYKYRDDFLEYYAIASKDSLKYNKLLVIDSLYLLEASKKIGKKIFKELTVKNTNPSVVITDLKSLSFETPKEYSKFSLGAHLGYNVFTQQPTISIGLNFDVIRFKKKIK
jgi:hypothetical protein